MNPLSNNIPQVDRSGLQARKSSPATPAQESTPVDPWGSDRVDLSSALDEATLNISSGWRDVFEIHGPRGVRTVCSETRPLAGKGETVRGTPFSVGPAGSPLCR